MQRLNEWIQSNRESYTKYIDDICNSESEQVAIPGTVPLRVKWNALGKMHRHLCLFASKINGHLEKLQLEVGEDNV